MNLIIQTNTGQVKGVETEGIRAWYGIPFAKPPVGDLRFKRAQPVDSWEGVMECTNYGNDPIQYVGQREKEAEDCLNLNIWASKDAKKLPVLVWIYGGGFHFGYNSDLSYDGAQMAASGEVVRVNINFRLGPLGYYDFNQYDNELFDTNCGLSDQIEALKWVKENIEAFGGDPDNITIAGESGGGCAVFNLLASPAAKGLYHKAIAQSGLPRASGGRAFTKISIPQYLKHLGVQPDDISKLKSMDVAKIREAGAAFYNEFTKEYSGMFMPGPFFGDDLLPERHWTALKNGSADGVPVIIGYNRDEGDTFVTDSEFNKAWFPSWNDVETMLRNNGKEHYFNELRAAYVRFAEPKGLSEFVKDYLFAMDAHRCADEQSKHGNVWMYRFDFVPVAYKHMKMGAVHAVEVPFSLNTIDRGYFSYALRGTPQEQLDAVRNHMNDSWLNFMRTGNPSGGEVNWTKYESETSMLHLFDGESSNQSIRIDDKVVKVWEKIGLLYDKE
ncbi:carboxylesterase/lipase family protein [Paenibacillus sp. YIM B09110]|uniref:carboxylesterase/lipase family protein n=1 Tax=Paenibacillus sp. YIM B09110 TaxID=3126102 RepID=UPI00301DF56B